MVLPGRELLSGAVEVDESSIGARRSGSGGRGAGSKAIVAIAVEGDHAPERVRMRRIPDVTKDTLTDFVLEHVARGSEVRTDGWQGYFDVGRHRFTHVVTNVSASGDPGHVVLGHVHLVASLVKRWILGTHQGAVSHAQLDYYLDEFTFRFNRRHLATAACCSTGSWRVPSPPIHTPTRPLPQDQPPDQTQSRIGGAKRIPSSREGSRAPVAPSYAAGCDSVRCGSATSPGLVDAPA
jgi:transposase-like protein